MKIEDNLTAEQCVEIGDRIINGFYRLCEGGTEYGCDWPTMWILWPARCRVYKRLSRRVAQLRGT